MLRTALKILLLWCLTILVLFLLRQIAVTNAAETSSNTVIFCEILPNPDGTDTKDNEYFKLLNSSSTEVALTGWKVCNLTNDCYFLKETVAAGSCFKISRTVFIFTLHNDKEELSLFDQNNTLMDKIVTGSAPSGKSWQCYAGNCAWGAPQDSCDYSFLLPKEELPENENANLSDDSPVVETQTNSNGNGNNNTNVTAKASEASFYSINDSQDFSRLRKKLRKEKLVSVLVNIKGTVALPPGLMAKTYFYLSSKNQLLKTHAYSSCRNSPDCLRDIELVQEKKLNLTGATLKLIEDRFELFLDKSTCVKENGNQKLKKASKVARINGTIVAKKGDYFFVEDEKDTKIYSVYISKPLQNTYVKKLGAVPLGYFPFYQATKLSRTWIGGKIDLSGVKEKVGFEERIIAYKVNKLEPAVDEPEEKKKEEKPKADPQKPEKNKVAVSESASSKDQQRENKADTKKINKEQVKIILAQNISWQSLWNIMISKLANRINMLRQYF